MHIFLDFSKITVDYAIYFCCRMMVSIVVFLLFMMGLFGLKENAVIPVLILPLLVICIIFWHYVNEVFAKQSAALTFSSCAKLRDLDTHLIQVNEKWIKQPSWYHVVH